MMKIISYILLSIALLFGISCNKILDTKPTDYYTPANFYENKSQLQQALTTAYGNLMTQQLYGQVLGFNFTVSNDELLSSRTTDGDTRGLRFNFDASNSYAGNIWRYCYIGIQNLNGLIDNINKPTSLDSASKHIILGQALFLRGYYYFLLTTHYGDVPLLLHIPDISEVNIAANKQADVYAQIETDMKSAESLLQTENYTSARLGYNDVVTLTAVQAILARVYLYWAGYPQNNVAKYQDVKTYTQKVINSGLHALNPDYRQLFINLSQDKYDINENIWELGFYSAAAGSTVKTGNDIGNFVGPASTYLVTDTSSWAAGGWVYTTRKLFDTYQIDSNSTATVKASYDIRRDWNCANYYWSGSPRVKTTVIGPWHMYSGKFRREYCTWISRANGIYGINWPVIRYADVLLMDAEAENYLNGPTAQAYADINAVRQRGYGLLNGNVVKTVTITNPGSGYTTAPAINIIGGGGNGASAIAQVTSGRISGIYLSSPGATTVGAAYTSNPTITIGNTWASGRAYTIGMQITNAGNLYTVTTAGTSTSSAPVQTSGASNASVTGAVFTYAGVAAIATATLTTGNEYMLTVGLSKSDFFLAIRDERLRELNAEGLRRFDLIRWGNYIGDIQDFVAYATANGISSASTTTGGGNPNGLIGVQNINSTKFNLLPIPTYELNLNHLLIQNKGW